MHQEKNLNIAISHFLRKPKLSCLNSKDPFFVRLFERLSEGCAVRFQNIIFVNELSVLQLVMDADGPEKNRKVSMQRSLL